MLKESHSLYLSPGLVFPIVQMLRHMGWVTIQIPNLKQSSQFGIDKFRR